MTDRLDVTGRWPEVLRALGVDSRFLRNKHGPCPHCGGKDRYRFDNKGGKGTWICSKCGAGDGFGLLKLLKGWDYGAAADAIRQIIGGIKRGKIGGHTKDQREHTRDMGNFWRKSGPLTEGGIVERYLRWRGIMVPISTLHDLRQRDDEMVAVIRAPGGVAKQLHRTVFKGKDRTRLFWPGPLPAGGAVRLMEHGDTLGIAEGIETALSASVLFGMPCWAALNANQMACWVAPKEIKSVIIFGDHDTSFDGQRAAYHLAKRLLMKQISVDVRFPGITVDRDWIDKDWNDVIRDYSGPGLAPNGAAVA